MRMTCPACATANSDGAKFCVECGAPLRAACPACGTAHAPGQRFCAECGGALGASTPPDALGGVPSPTERRLVSVLFADLVGFTTLSETRDAEDVRELLSRYFDTCRRLIELYGGTVEKFIGDAVMAVWGTPVAQEDDAERAVRTALDLVAAVSGLGDELGLPELRARAAVLTGEAAVAIGATGQGMVAGDLVNAASRLQSAADPGSVLVGEATRRAAEAAIAFEPAGEHTLKGRSEPLRAWRALRVTASRGGALKAEGLEAPFVGRGRELRLAKELFHAAAEQGNAHLLSVVGVAGIGKSRLAWELEKYLDGLLDQVWWHRGRCLAYGDGVAYWALAEMVRMRARISEEDGTESALAKLDMALAEHVSDPAEREWLEPRLAHLIGVGSAAPGDRNDLFSAWRVFFERLSDESPTVLVFEDLQWADASLLDFIEHLLDWSRGRRLFVLTLSRPELADRRAGFAAVARNATTLSLEPLPPAVMGELLDGLVPGLPGDLRRRIVERADGVPLYAVETVRMLLDRGLLERDGPVYRPAGEIADLQVPETLHALIAARLDGLDDAERRLVQDASVLGKSFTEAGASALSGSPGSELQRLLGGLIRKEILILQSDPRSPERGQYSFVQDLLRRVAYETLSRHDRRSRHLAAAAHLEQVWSDAPEQELSEVVAAHYLEALAAAPDAADAGEIRARAAERLVRAAQRAASLAANDEAQGHYDRASELATDTLERAVLIEQAGNMALIGFRVDGAIERFERAIELFRAEGATHPAARVTAGLGRALYARGDLAVAIERLEEACAVLAGELPDADLAAALAELARMHYFVGDYDPAGRRVEQSLEIAEGLGDAGVLVEALNTKHLVLDRRGRRQESLALLERAHAIAVEHDLGQPLSRAIVNLAYRQIGRGDLAAATHTDLSGLELARRRGDRGHELIFLLHLEANRYQSGDWDDAVQLGEELSERFPDAVEAQLMGFSAVLARRGDLAGARRLVDRASHEGTSEEAQLRLMFALAEAELLLAEGRGDRAIDTAERGLDDFGGLSESHPAGHGLWAVGVEAALALGAGDRADALLGQFDRLRPVDRTRPLRGQYARFRGGLAILNGDHDSAVELLRRARDELGGAGGRPFPRAQVELELGEYLAGRGDPEAVALLDAARVEFERLGARPWLERAQAALEAVAVRG